MTSSDPTLLDVLSCLLFFVVVFYFALFVSQVFLLSYILIHFSLQMTSSDPILLDVLTPERDMQSGVVVLYPVRLRDSLTLWEREQLDLYVELSNQRTGQKQRVPVYVKLIGQKPDIPRKIMAARLRGKQSRQNNAIDNEEEEDKFCLTCTFFVSWY